nr:DUF3800 domain-containing protein [Microvirga terricola]
MTHSFVAYIDESGDDGIGNFRQPGAHGGSSSWLVISACVFRKSFDLDAVGWRDEISALMPEKRKRTIHFAHMAHGQKLAACRSLAARPIRSLSILSNKTTIPDGTYTDKNQLYFYLTRYLIERLSWLCRDLRPRVPQGDGRVMITFSRRGGMSYPDFRSYLERLRSAQDNDVKIHWPVIDIDGIDAKDHSTHAGLQLADVVASAFASGVEADKYGNCESRYAELLKRTVYERNGNYLSYGLKLVPRHNDMTLNAEQRRLIDLFK